MSRDELDTLSSLAAAQVGSGLCGGVLLSLNRLGLIAFSIDGWRLTATGWTTVAMCSPAPHVAQPGLPRGS